VRFDSQEISGSSGLRTTWKIVYAGWFVALCVLAMNAISITVLRVATASSGELLMIKRI
jgi:hypothetical protein